MRFSSSVVALSLALAQGTAANNVFGRKFRNLAEIGLNPDGTPMHSSDQVTTSLFASSKYAKPPPPPPNETIVAEYVELPIDNFAENENYANEGTFNNRYWVSTDSYKPGGPVFLYDAGEADAAPNALFRLQNETSFFKQLMDHFGAIGIVWEHRYYGNSTPGGGVIDINTPPEAFKWLTTEQSLADVDRFAKQFSRPGINASLTPDKTPWVFVGGSYPGMRAAFIREKYPETIFAGYASSAPVQAQVDMSVYFEPVVRGLKAYGWGNCTNDIYAAIQYIDKQLEKPAAAAALKQKFLGLGAANNTNAGFADALSFFTGSWQSYGVEGAAYGFRQFCDWIESDPASNQTAPAEGWAKSRGANYTVERWSKYPSMVGVVNDLLTTNCSGSQTVQGNCDLNRPYTEPDWISWTWQYCTQWGFFQSANLGPNQIISKYNSQKHQRDICHRQFPTASPDLFPELPNVDETNESLGGWDIRPSQVYWSGGEFDPWRTLSPLSAEPFAPHPKTFTDPPACGEEQDKSEIFGYVMKNAQHCYDFRTTFEGGAVSRKYFADALTKWLGCFKPKGGKARPRSWRA